MDIIYGTLITASIGGLFSWLAYLTKINVTGHRELERRKYLIAQSQKDIDELKTNIKDLNIRIDNALLEKKCPSENS